jgi:hypothetical protein
MTPNRDAGPLPGMDPWLEEHWLDVHAAAGIYLRDLIQESLPGDLIARVEEGLTIESPDDQTRTMRPDVRVFEPSGGSAGGSATALAEAEVAQEIEVDEDGLPLLYDVPALDPEVLRFVAIRDAAGEERLVTSIELMSPANKNGFIGRWAFQRKRKACQGAGVNLVEIDLVRGPTNFELPDEHLGRRRETDQFTVIWKPRPADFFTVHRMPLRRPLPTIEIPLRPGDPKLTVNLQSLIDMTYRRGRYARTIDYRRELNPPLSYRDQTWVLEQVTAWEKARASGG